MACRKLRRPGVWMGSLALMCSLAGMPAPTRADPNSSQVLLAELLISPSSSNQPEEYIKLYNPTLETVSLDGWSLTTLTGHSGTAATATFPTGAAVGPGEAVVATRDARMYLQQVDPYARMARNPAQAAVFEYGSTDTGLTAQLTRNTAYDLALSDTSAAVLLKNSRGLVVDVVRYTRCERVTGSDYTCSTPTPYSGPGWSGDPVKWAQLAGQRFNPYARHKVLSRAIDESTVSGTSAGLYRPDTDTALDWLSAAINSRTGLEYWAAATSPLSTRDLAVGQSLSRPQPVWNFTGQVQAFMAPDTAFATIAGLFEGATASIDLNMYDFQLVDMAHVLVAARQRGVTVRVLLEGQPCCNFALNDQQKYVATLLHQAGVEVRFMQGDPTSPFTAAAQPRVRRYTNVNHAKYAVVDQAAADPRLLIFSGNFKRSSTPRHPGSGNRDWGLIIHNAAAAQYFGQVFADDFDPNRRDSVPYGFACQYSACHLGAPSPGFAPDLSGTEDPDATYPAPFSARTVQGQFAVTPVLVPETAFLSERSVLGLIKQANRSVLLEWATLNAYWGSGMSSAGITTTPTPLVEELLNAARRGVQVRVLLEGKFDDSTDPKGNGATVAYLNQTARSEGLDLVAKLMAFTVVTGNPDSPDYLVREYPGYNGVHNKSIVVDSRQTLVSSLNGTQASWLRNRETAVIVDNADVAGYFTDAFWFDWYDGNRPEWPVLSEVQYDPPGGDSQHEWLELYNPTGQAADLSGWSLQNDRGQWSFPPGTTLGAGSTLTVARSRSGFAAQHGFDPDVSGLTLSLSNTGDLVRLMAPDGGEVDQVAWDGYLPDWQPVAAPGQALVRTNACRDTNSRLDWASATPQAGSAACHHAAPPEPEPEPEPEPAPPATVLLSEVHYDSRSPLNPEPDEYIELYNPGATAADVGGYQLRDNADTFVIPVGTAIGPGGYLTVTRNGSAFQTAFGRSADLTGLNLLLGNSGDTVTLLDASGQQRDLVAWEGHRVGWTGRAAAGWTLHRHSGNGDNPLPADWVTGDPTPGSGIPAGVPEVTAFLTPEQPDGANGWYTSGVTQTGESAAWGLIRLETSADGGATWTTVATRSTTAPLAPLPLAAGVTRPADTAGSSVLFRATDGLGRQGIATVTWQKDATPPTTVATPAGAPDDNGSYRSPVDISLAAIDDTAGVARTEYSLDGGQNWAPYTGPFTLTDSGEQTVLYRSTDLAGNVEATRTLALRIGAPEDCLAPRLAWRPPLGGAEPTAVRRDDTLQMAFTWGACGVNRRDEGVLIMVRSLVAPFPPVAAYVWGYDIAYAEATGEYSQVFSPGWYALDPDTPLAVEVYMGGGQVGVARVNVTR